MKAISFKRSVSAVTAALCLSAAFPPALLNANAGTTTVGGYDYECWTDMDSDKYTFTPNDNGGFDASWEFSSDGFFSKGLIDSSKPKSKNYCISYDVSSSVDPDTAADNYCSFICAYGYSLDPHSTFMITDSFIGVPFVGTENSSFKKVGELTSNGEHYDLYYYKYIQRSIAGEQYEIEQFYSMRKGAETDAAEINRKGTINFGDHLNAFEKLGYKIGDIDRISFNVEAYKCSGSAKLKSCEITELTGETTEPEEIKGDLNNDMRVDSFDVVLCRRELIKAADNAGVNMLADMDSNGKVQINDLVLISNFVLGKK